MGFRFRRRINLFPGLTLNLSGSGVSATVGVPGANINIGPRGIYGTAGIPGSGLHYRTSTTKFGGGDQGYRQTPTDGAPPDFVPYDFRRAGQEYKSKAGDLTTPNLQALKQMIFDHRDQKAEACENVARLTQELKSEKRRKLLFDIVSLGVILKDKRQSIRDEIAELEENIDFEGEIASTEGLKVHLSEGTELDEAWKFFVSAFAGLVAANRIWDVSYISENDAYYQRVMRSNAANSYDRHPVTFSIVNASIFDSDFQIGKLENHNGGDIYIYPGFIHLEQGADGLSLIDFLQLDMHCERQSFIEEEGVPPDSEVIGQVWAKANKDGSPDLRFRQNYQIPVCEYAEISLSSPGGLNEKYLVSNVDAAERFVSAFQAFRKKLRHQVSFQIEGTEGHLIEESKETVEGLLSAPEDSGPNDQSDNLRSNEAPDTAEASSLDGVSDRLEEIQKGLKNLKRKLARSFLKTAKENLNAEQRAILLSAGEESVVQQIYEQIPDEIDGSELVFSITIDHTDEDGDHHDSLTLRFDEYF